MDDLKERIEAIPGRLDRVRERIERAAGTAGRDPAAVRLVAVTKSFPLEIVRGAIDAGISDIGENRVQEGREKIEAAGREAATWHLVGHLQSNKARWAIRLFDMIQSVDSLPLAEELQHRAEIEEREVPVLVQVGMMRPPGTNPALSWGPPGLRSRFGASTQRIPSGRSSRITILSRCDTGISVTSSY